MKSTAVLIARFQTTKLHEGHRSMIESIRKEHHRVVVVLGVAPVRASSRNPFDVHVRERMLKADYPELLVLPLKDHPSDRVWSAQLDELLTSSFPGESFLLYGGRDSFIPAYTGRLPVRELPAVPGCSSTEMREEFADRALASESFRIGINYACQNRRPTVYPAVDIALFSERGTQLLMGQKASRTEWRLPGGFIDPTDTSAESAAKRELFEECGAVETGPMMYLGSFQVDDWRYRKERDKILSFLFTTDLLFGQPQAADDLQTVRWFAVADLEKMIAEGKVASEHVPLIRMLLTRLSK